MYVHRKRTWVELIVMGRSLPHIWRRVLLVTVIAIVLTALDPFVPWLRHLHISPVPFTLIGLPLGIFLGFRNNTSYDRFWEGRRLWGSLVNTSRSLGRQVLTLVERDAFDESPRSIPGSTPDDVREFQRQLIYRLIGFVHALRLHLRVQPFDELARHLPPDEYASLASEKNVPTAVVFAMGRELQRAWHKGWIHPQHLMVFEASLTELTNIQGACERIKNTPIPFSYTVLIHRIVATYCVLLPLGLVDTVKAASPVVTMLVCYTFFGLDAIGDEVEDPFGTDKNDLPLLTLSTMIEINLRQRLGETALPKPIEPVDDVLY